MPQTPVVPDHEMKNIFTSKTIIGQITATVGFIAVIGQTFGWFDLNPEQQTALVEGIGSVLAGIGIVLGIIGRLTVKKRLTM